MPKNVQDASWDRLGVEKPVDSRVLGGHVGSQNGAKIDVGATFGRLGRTFLGDLVANRFFIDFLTIFHRFWDGFWSQKRSQDVTQQREGKFVKI